MLTTKKKKRYPGRDRRYDLDKPSKVVPQNSTTRVVGPYGEWVGYPLLTGPKVRLTNEGRDILASWVEQYPNPLGLLRHVKPSIYTACRHAGLTDEEINAACLEGYVLTLIRYDPARSGIKTSLGYGVMGTASDLLRKTQNQRRLHALDSSESWMFAGTHEAPDGVPEPAAKRGVSPDDIEELHWFLESSNLTSRDRRILWMHAHNGQLSDIGDELGLSKERARQLILGALAKIRSHHGIWTESEKREIARAERFARRVFRSIREHGPITRSQIASRTGMCVESIRCAIVTLKRAGKIEKCRDTREGTQQFRVLKKAVIA